MSDGQRGPEVTQEVPFVESESIDSFECHKVQALLHPELHHRLMRVQSELRQRDLVGFLMGDLGRQMNVKAGLAKDPLRANVQELRDLAHTPVVLVVGPDLDRLSIPDEIKNLVSDEKKEFSEDKERFNWFSISFKLLTTLCILKILNF